MQSIKTKEDVSRLTDNRVIGADGLTLTNSEIRFAGVNNVLYINGNVELKDSIVKFNGDNSIIFLCESKHPYYLDATVNYNNVFYMGYDNYLNGRLSVVLSEQKNIVIGNENLFSFGIWGRTADPHLVYSEETRRRINPSKSVFIGDHVWLGQNAMLLKGTRIHSGSIVGAMALTAGKEIESNTSWGGNPARQIAQGIFWHRDCVHQWNDEQTAAHETYEKASFIYRNNAEEYIPFAAVDKSLAGTDADAKLAYLKQLSENKDKNRFSLRIKTKQSVLKRALAKIRRMMRK